MSAIEAKERHARLKMAHGPSGPTLTAQVPLDLSEEDFTRVARAAYGVIHNLTGCNCMSGRISFVVEDNFADVIRVNLAEAP
jgi:hypothetical protein